MSNFAVDAFFDAPKFLSSVDRDISTSYGYPWQRVVSACEFASITMYRRSLSLNISKMVADTITVTIND